MRLRRFLLVVLTLFVLVPQLAHASSDNDEALYEGLPEFMTLPPFTIPVVQEGVPIRFITYTIVIEFDRSEESKEKITKKMPRLTDAYFRYLHGIGSTLLYRKMNDLAFIKNSLLKVTNDIVGEGVVHSVLVTSSFNTRLRRRTSQH